MSAYAQQIIGWLEAAIVFALACQTLSIAALLIVIRENRELRAGREPTFIPALLRRLAC